MPTEMNGLKNEVIVQKAHRYDYDHAMRNCGIRFVDVETLQEYESEFTRNTVMCFFYNAADAGQINREDWIRVAHAHGVPCLNDAAADVPPISNLWNYTQMGYNGAYINYGGNYQNISLAWQYSWVGWPK